MEEFDVSERLACRVLGQHRSTRRKMHRGRADDAVLTAKIVALATQYRRYGYRRIAAILKTVGWVVNVKRVERIWRLEGLKVLARQSNRGRLWLNESSCVRLQLVVVEWVTGIAFESRRLRNALAVPDESINHL